MESPGITGRTRLMALIADPVVQARSPGMVNALLQSRGRFGDAVLVPLQVPGGGLDAVLTGLRRVGNFAGAIVSMPHKAAVVPLLDVLTPEAEQVGAVNVVRREPDGRLAGTMLDGEGFVAGLRAAGHDVAGRRCLLIGAGGAASAVAFSLARHGCAALTIVNRTPSKAATLAHRVRQAFPAVDARAGSPGAATWDVAINGTSLGMQPDDALPMDEATVLRSALVADCVVAPEETRLLGLARAKGRATHTGVPMLEAQLELLLDFMGAG